MKCYRTLITVRWPMVGVLVLTMLALTFGCAKKEPQEIKIGAILPLTGDGAKYGEEARRGIELALKQIQEPNVEVLYEDDQGSSTGGVSAFNKLVESGGVPVIIGPMYSSTALAIAPLGQKKKVVIFSPSASSPELAKAGDYFFRNWPSDVYEGGELARFAYDGLNLRSAAILSVNLDYGVGLTTVFNEAFEILGGEILAIQYYDQGAVDFRTQLSKIRLHNPDAVYLPGYYAEIGLILRQAREMGLKTQFLSCVGFDNPKSLEIAGVAAEGVIFARPYFSPESQDPLLQGFVEDFTRRYGITPGVYAAHAYDALRIVVEAIKIGGYSADGIRTGLHSISNFPGVTGNTSFDEHGDVRKPIQIVRVSNGRFKTYSN